MNELQVFSYNGTEVRAVMKGGESWWVLKDVCDVLGLSNPSEVYKRLDADEKASVNMNTLSQAEGIPCTERGNPNMTIINEPGLYNVIIRSDKPEAKAFKRWITHEVLPSIRKHGAYSLPSKRRLGEVNSAARFLDKSLRDAGVPPEFRIMTVKQLYETVGVKVITQGVATPAKMYEATEIAERLNMRSRKGFPHAQAVGAIIEKVGCADSERTVVPFSRNGHSGTSVQYAETVLQRVERWTRENNFPETISFNGKNLSVLYS